MNTLLTKFVTSMLKGFFYDEAHAHQFGSGLFHKFHDAFGSISVGQEIIDEKYPVARTEKVFTDTYIIGAFIDVR